MIKAEVFNQKIRLDTESVASDSVKYLSIKFILDSAWQNTLKTAVFKNDSISQSKAVILEEGNELYLGDNTCLVPFEVIKPPYFTVSLSGVDDEKVITTVPATVKVYQSGEITADTPDEYTPSQYQQLVSIYEETKQIAQSVRDDADNGLFKGDKGEDGITPIVDQKFDATSINAQSGTAVAEGIDATLGEVNNVFGTLLDGSDALPEALANLIYKNLSKDLVPVFEKYIDQKITKKLGTNFKTSVTTYTSAGSVNIEPNAIYALISEDETGIITLFDDDTQQNVEFTGKYLGLITGNYSDYSLNKVLGLGGALGLSSINRGTFTAISANFTATISWSGNATVVIVKNVEANNG